MHARTHAHAYMLIQTQTHTGTHSHYTHRHTHTHTQTCNHPVSKRRTEPPTSQNGWLDTRLATVHASLNLTFLFSCWHTSFPAAELSVLMLGLTFHSWSGGRERGGGGRGGKGWGLREIVHKHLSACLSHSLIYQHYPTLVCSELVTCETDFSDLQHQLAWAEQLH